MAHRASVMIAIILGTGLARSSASCCLWWWSTPAAVMRRALRPCRRVSVTFLGT